jgi:hypothetical protein
MYVNGDSMESLYSFIKDTKSHRSLELSPLSVSIVVDPYIGAFNCGFHAFLYQMILLKSGETECRELSSP